MRSLFGFLFFVLFAASPVIAASPPNVVLIISDDHAWTDYSFMGHPHIQTPHIDRLAKEGVTFRRGHVTSSLCCPSLATILTGLYPHQHLITSNDPPVPPGTPPRNFHQSPAFKEGRETMNRHLDAVPTLPKLLAKQNYLSLQTGKWWQGNYARGGFTHGMTRGERHGDDGLNIGRKTMQPIRDFIQEAGKKQRPFLVWYAPMLPHSPHNPPERLLKKYLPRTPSPHIARYWAMVEWFDETVGELRNILNEAKVADNTLIIYIADNGWIQRPDNPAYAPRSKQSQYEGGLRTPIILHAPGKIPPRMTDELASSIDILPTILKFTGQDLPPDLPGLNLLDPQALGKRSAIFGECFTHNAVDLNRPAANLRYRWIISGSDKLIVPDAVNEPKASPELFDLTTDPEEKTDLAAKSPDRVQSLRTQLDHWWNPK
ncbi:MAG: sulfatase-like hydrolase/transferase [Planctomycetales bacterium]